MKTRTEKYFEEFITRYPDLTGEVNKIKVAVNALISASEFSKILTCGNGGSSADAEHFSAELLKSFELKRELSKEDKQKFLSFYGEEGDEISKNLQQGVKCIPISSFTAFNTAFANDCVGKYSYAQLVNVLGEEGDVLIAFSTSGNAENVVLASKTAKVKGIKVIAFTGNYGGKLKETCDILINVPEDKTYAIQEKHVAVYHLICRAIESELYD